jgi:hypothetical protein
MGYKAKCDEYIVRIASLKEQIREIENDRGRLSKQRNTAQIKAQLWDDNREILEILLEQRAREVSLDNSQPEDIEY